jgi:hypothetical protein
LQDPDRRKVGGRNIRQHQTIIIVGSTLPAIPLLTRLHGLSRPLARLSIPYRATTTRFISYTKTQATKPGPLDLPRHTANMPTTLKQFESVFPKLVADLKQHAEQYKLPTQALKWFEEVGQT